MRKLAVCFLISCLLGAAAIAQDVRRNEIGLLLGAEFLSGRTTATGSSIDLSRSIVFSADYARRFAGENTAIFLEFPFAAAPSHRTKDPQTGVITDLATLFVTPSLRLQFARNKTLSPWASAGFGYGEYEGSNLLAGGATNPDVRQHMGAVQFGGGVDVHTPVKILLPVSLRAEVRDYYTASSPSFGVPVRDDGQHNVVAAAGFVIHF